MLSSGDKMETHSLVVLGKPILQLPLSFQPFQKGPQAVCFSQMNLAGCALQRTGVILKQKGNGLTGKSGIFSGGLHAQLIPQMNGNLKGSRSVATPPISEKLQKPP